MPGWSWSCLCLEAPAGAAQEVSSLACTQMQVVNSKGTDRLERHSLFPGAKHCVWTAEYRQAGESSLGEMGAELDL